MACIFCQIVSGEMPSHKVYEDENILAFLDIKPKSAGHTLFITKKHFADFLSAPIDEVNKLVAAVRNITPSILRAVGADDFNLGLNNGPAAGQLVPHVHIHIIPRQGYARDDWRDKTYTEKEMSTLAESIRSADLRG